jgi:FkbM family methyltransferase|tara:strand:- start:6158 stop:6766 length:609 start_codon:yes stop_codon:yes gene_type:complete
MNCNLIQVGSHIGNTSNDYIFNNITLNGLCIFIEPVEEYFNTLKENYNKKYPDNNFLFFNIACSDVNHTLTLYKPIVDDKSPLWANQLTSVLPNHAKNHNINVGLNPIEIQAKTLNTVISENNIDSIDILAVDTEGYDYEVLQGIDLDKIKPKEIIFEHKHIDGTNQSFGFKYYKLINHLFSKNYELIKQTEDDTYMKLRNG